MSQMTVGGRPQQVIISHYQGGRNKTISVIAKTFQDCYIWRIVERNGQNVRLVV